MWKKLNNLWVGSLRPKLIVFLLFITKGEFLYISFAFILTIVIGIWTFLLSGDICSAIELSTFSAVVLEGFLVAVTGIFRSCLLNFTEDPAKLTTDYSSLITHRYSSERNCVWCRNPHGIQVIPAVHVAWLYNRKVLIVDSPDSSYEPPNIINKYYGELLSTHSTSSICNNINIRVNNWYIDDIGHFVMQTGRTTYYNSLVTNRAMDYRLGKGMSVRELLECGPFLHPLKSSRLSNHLGFNGFVESSDGQVMLVYRKSNLSIGKRTYGDSIGASLKAKYALNDHLEFSVSGLREGIIREIKDELGIPEDSLVEDARAFQQGLGPIELIAAYRDLLEGGKPQLLFYTKTSLCRREIQEVFDCKNERNTTSKTQKGRRGKESTLETDGNVLYWMPIKELCQCEVCSDKLIHDGLQLPMVPSASASVAMLLAYLHNKNDANNECGGKHMGVDYTMNSYGNQVVEQYLRGKHGNQTTCEDACYLGSRFVAVIDGVTSKGHLSYAGKTSGQFAAEVLMKAFRQLDYSSGEDRPLSVLKYLNKTLAQAREDYALAAGINISIEDYPRASVIYFDRKHKEVVSYGDCQCRIGNAVFTHTKLIDTILSEKRARIIKGCLVAGTPIEELRRNDPGRTAIQDDLLNQLAYENTPGEFGYPVLNGQDICGEMIVIHEVQPGEPVILCSDGYPEVCATLEESERKLEQVLHEDPLLIQLHLSTKGWSTSDVSYDDRAWIRL